MANRLPRPQHPSRRLLPCLKQLLKRPAAAPAAASEASAPAPVAADNARVVYENGVATFFFATGKNDVAEGAQTIVADVINAGKDGKKLVVQRLCRQHR